MLTSKQRRFAGCLEFSFPAAVLSFLTGMVPALASPPADLFPGRGGEAPVMLDMRDANRSPDSFGGPVEVIMDPLVAWGSHKSGSHPEDADQIDFARDRRRRVFEEMKYANNDEARVPTSRGRADGTEVDFLPIYSSISVYGSFGAYNRGWRRSGTGLGIVWTIPVWPHPGSPYGRY